MKMMQIFLIFSFLFVFLPLCRADVLDDFEVELAKVAQTGNYKNAVNAPESRFAGEYEKSLQHLVSLGRRLDKSVMDSLPGSSFAFQFLARSLVNIYTFNAEKMQHPENYKKKQNRNRRSRSSKNKNDLKKIMQDPVPIFKLLLADMKSLRKIGFTEGGSSSVSGKSILAKDLLNFRLGLSTFTAFRGQYFRKKTPEAFRKEFDRRLTALSHTARKLQDSLQRYGGKNAALECNIARETSLILRTFEKYRKHVLEGRRGSGKNTVSTYLREIRFSIQKIEGALSALSRAGLESAAVSPRIIPGKRNRSASYGNMSQSALEKELLRKRALIYKGNALMDGVDKATLRKYLLTLTKEEKKIYERIRKERITNGYSTESATKTALLAVHSKMKIDADKKTLLSLLEKLEKEEEKEQQKDWK